MWIQAASSWIKLRFLNDTICILEFVTVDVILNSDKLEQVVIPQQPGGLCCHIWMDSFWITQLNLNTQLKHVLFFFYII